jgi:hypothetical protein
LLHPLSVIIIIIFGVIIIIIIIIIIYIIIVNSIIIIIIISSPFTAVSPSDAPRGDDRAHQQPAHFRDHDSHPARGALQL